MLIESSFQITKYYLSNIQVILFFRYQFLPARDTWSSDEGIDLNIEGEKVILCIPKQYAERLNQPVFIYKLKGDTFAQTAEEQTGETMHTEERIRPEEVRQFTSVTEALEYYGGAVEQF